MARSYYIRNRGKRLGPLTIEKLQLMARRGRFGRHFEVSTDGKRWAKADEYPELFPSGSGGGGGQADDDDFDDDAAGDDVDPYAPLVDDEKPSARRTAGSARRGRSRDRSAAGDGDDGSSRRARSAGGRSEGRSAGRGERPAQRSRRGSEADEPEERPRKRRAEAEGAPEERAARPAKPVKKKKSKPLAFADVPEDSKKGGGLMGFLFGSRRTIEDEHPHLKKMNHVIGTLRDIGFGPEKIVFVGAGGDEIAVAEHMNTGDGPHLLGLLTLIAFQSKTTDIHCEPTPTGTEIRMRIDGTLVPLVEISKTAIQRMFGVIKVLCQIQLGGKMDVQEGSYSSVAPGRRADFRISFTPSVHGQKLAIRVLDANNSPQTLKQLGLPPAFVKTISSVMKQNAGMVLMCGPTGSGKTTTLYSMLRSVDFRTRNVMTLEDPVEYQIDGITQINIDSEHGKSFSDMLPALLRQDPDVLLIGEIRDAESAKIAMQATMTGHLVLSTVHAPDTLSTLHRLLDLNADPNMVAAALDLIMSQRLLRTLCDDCKRRRRPDKEDARKLGNMLRDAVYDPGGCRKCLGTGYAGRRAIFELLDVKKQVGDAIHGNPNIVQLRKAVQGTSFQTLRQNGYSLVARGVTTYDEVDRVIGVE
ncbi:MAG: Flp pilus assembly complex ATPase component TadA [Planctomycetaceae bacterium]|nr:Flp pilus assembly complex ATPase component TadA [Planctomycetaceae bacterium]